MKKFNQRGFVGLLGLLITAAIIAFLAVKIFTRLYGISDTPAAGDSSAPAELSQPNPITRGRSIIESAEEAKRMIEQQSQSNGE